MITISSAKPFEANPEYALNQERGFVSLRDNYSVSAIFYVGHFEQGLDCDKTLFVKPDGDYPRIKMMAEFAAEMTADYVAILNADIVLGGDITAIEQKMKGMSLPAATSYRYEYDPEVYPDMSGATRHKEDRGMDIFIATPLIWKTLAKEVPSDLWFGNPTWDTWVCGWLCHNLGYGFRHFTEQRCVFHPRHGGRTTPMAPQVTSDSPYFTRATRPSPL